MPAQVKFLDALGHGLSPGSPRGADVGYPVLGDAPPFHLVTASNKGRHFAGLRKDGSHLGLVAADMREITDVGLKLIPVALVGKADNRVKLVLTHELTHSTPATCSFLPAELRQAKALFHRCLSLISLFSRIFFSLYEVHRSGSRIGLELRSSRC